MEKKIETIRKQLEESFRVNQALFKKVSTMMKIAEKLVNCFRCGNKVWLFGNGGSAADAQHIAAELAGKYYLDREPLPAAALTTNTSTLTAIGNDYSFAEIFSRQVRGLVGRGDVVIGISTSGNSLNVVKAMEEAKRRGAWTVAFTGRGGKLLEIADECLNIPSSDTPRIQEAHITVGHIICYLVEELMFEGDKK